MQGNPSRASRLVAALAACAVLGGAAGNARAQNFPAGYQLNKYEPSTVGDPFLYVEHPWYSSIRYFAIGLTFDYARNLLLTGSIDRNGNITRQTPLVGNQFQTHVDIAGSFLDRVALSVSLPLNLWEQGSTIQGTLAGPNSGVFIGDLRFGARVRLFGQPEDSAISMSVAGNLWVPLPDTYLHHVGDNGIRGAGKLLIGGVVAEHLRYTVNGGFYYRPTAQFDKTLSNQGNTVGMEVQVGAGLQATFLNKSLSFGPEYLMSIPVFKDQPGIQTTTQSEILGTISYLILDQVMLQVSGGSRLYGTPSPPDIRVLARIAYAPRRKAETNHRLVLLS